ncbi:MAG: hypothetical protein N2376_09605, partial [Clostridia bacterium]|nr:hypothetical protein [Clostridia bacterium]
HNHLTFSFAPRGEKIPEVFDVSGQTITWKAVPNWEFYWSPVGFEGQSSAWWELTNENRKIGMRETTDFPILRVGIWGKAHVVSPELFIHLRVEPGTSKSWTRSYLFFNK